MIIRVTPRTIKIRAIYETIKSIKYFIPSWIMDIKLTYYKYHNAMLESYIRNPNLKW